jgi:beta-lactamase superfamily II metal-dependent hydrolase
MEVYFLDVGQGTSNVILVGGRRAIVIDTGRRAADLRLLLNHLHVSEIPCLILSHLDKDHVGGAPEVLTQYRGCIDRVCYPNDHRVQQTAFWDKLWAEIQDGHLAPDRLVRLEYEDRPKTLWRSTKLAAELKLFSPTFGENQAAIAGRDANRTSGVLVLKVGDRHLVFPGDSSLAQWQAIRQRRGAALGCDVLAIPHHAGMIWPAHWADPQIRGAMSWLYTEAVRPRFAVVSVGTSNTDGHPRPEVVQTLRALGVNVLCTQITRQCCDDLEGLRPGVLVPTLPGRSKAAPVFTSSDNSRDLACAGTVMAEVSPTDVVIRRVGQHRAAVDRLARAAGGHPLCR